MRVKFPLVPTGRAVWLAALAAPVALLVALIAPAAWLVAPIAAVALILAVLADGLLAGKLADWRFHAPDNAEVGEPFALTVLADIAGGAPGKVEAAWQCDPRLAPGGRATARLARSGDGASWNGSTELIASRRGTGELSRIWLNWSGPLGLGARQISQPLDREVRIWPDLAPIRSATLQALLRDAEIGLIARRQRGEGTQFEALTEYDAGMDRRRIDWKASARHTKLYARENESERNNQIVFAFDCGQAMCEPVDGVPRIDRAVTAGLTAAYVALKGGDRSMLFGFARRPMVATPFIGETRAFPKLQEAAAALEYQSEEPNFTLGLATLSARLRRRSLIVLFSEFTDPTSAELMIESISRLIEKHIVLFVTFEDTELEALRRAEPESMDAIAGAVTADSLARQRQLVHERLRHMGVDIIEAPHDRMGFAVIDRYLRIRRSEAIAG
ncbi:DUF58 domain-containing protein [Parerythrobacter jejuensis]|uniref:DUF58 domain-containing protein n=1 Tax=Parerythrobacter jejuensis TaxID=795812 RepID=A0A845AWP1_9SPHN|nr:DUF58 domain-containing protein [Parerythrobacter jejuensis]MXP30441.1 DUF58 domain-containing protein [Parerythrobacter jejuensis]MXP33201.1 DUF58 domain-containing protein [Parerythrobacter jejuensis]